MNALQTVFPDGEAVLTKTKPETKAGDGEGWNERENLLTPDEAKVRVRRGDNVGVALGHKTSDGLIPVVVDGEDPDAIPDAVVAWCNDRARFWWWSGHDGLNWLLLVTSEAYERLTPFHQNKLDFDGDGNHELELLTKGHALIPPSTIEHRRCRDSKDCDGTGTGRYRLVDVNSDAPVVDVPALIDLLDLLDLDPSEGSDGSTSTASYDPEDFPELSEADVEEGMERLGDFYQSTGEKPSDDLHDLLNGGAGNCNLDRRRDGAINRDRADLSAVFKAYGAMRDTDADRDRALELTYAVYSHFCEESRYMKDKKGEPRKWNRDEEYRMNQLTKAVAYYEEHREDWIRWKRRTYSTTEGSGRPLATHGNYSATTIDAVEGALHALANAETKDEVKTNVRAFALERDFAVPKSVSYPPPPSHEVPTPPEPADGGGMDTNPERRYPTRREVVSLAQQLDPSREESTHETVLRKVLRDDSGVAAMAKCSSRSNGDRWVYYPSNMADPTDADYVKENGREREPVDLRTGSPTAEQTAMTDGGAPREADGDSADGSDAKWQDLDWVGEEPEDDGDNDPESSGSRTDSGTAIANEADGPREGNDSASSSSAPCTPDSTGTSEDTEDTTPDKPPSTTETAG